MAHQQSWLLLLFLPILVALADTDRKVHIVYMGERPKGDFQAANLHLRLLEQVLGSLAASESLVHSYTRSFNGFAAKLTDQEAKKMAGMEGIVSVFPNTFKHLQTTRSWDFMGFPTTATHLAVESNVIIGLLDTGIWPESESFNDQGLGPPPSKWKGTCQGSSNFTCNNKIIGARFYHIDGRISPPDIDSPRDSEGHGSHTSSTAAGREVNNASLLGLAQGVARGAVPSARIAVYKICWSYGCSDADILAAFDDAIADGVDLISISVGAGYPQDYFKDSIAIGAFHAMKNGILSSNSAGNGGPAPLTITNFSPWSLSVAASSIDRRFVAIAGLGNGKNYTGNAINTFQLKGNLFPFIYGGDAPNTSAGYDGSESRYCDTNSLDSNLVKGKIVLCDQLELGDGVLLANGLGNIMRDTRELDSSFSWPLPTTLLNSADGDEVFNYLNSTSQPMATIFKSDELKDPNAPVVVSFSSRGPNPITKGILSPDLTAPGVDILAAWSPLGSPSVYSGDKRAFLYNIISGTSMSCPHAAGTAAYVKSFHPTWSPAAIKSALMTTAFPMNPTSTTPEAEFAYGAGHINPSKAINPGLVYDAGIDDFVKMLCNEGYSTKSLQLVTGDNSTCSGIANGTASDLNYPSLAISVRSGKSFSTNLPRTVTNVGSPGSYNATVSAPGKLQITVAPAVLTFKSLGEKKSFVVTVGGNIQESMLSASLVWSDGVHQVRSPIVVYT